MARRGETAASDLREEFERLEEAEELANDEEEDYTFGELREDVSTASLRGVSAGIIDIDDEDEVMYLHEDSFDKGFEFEGIEAGYADRSLKMEAAVFLGSLGGLGGSIYQFAKSGDPLYLGSGVLSTGFGASAFRRIMRTFSARSDGEHREEMIEEELGGMDDYVLRVLDDEEMERHIEENKGFAVYEREELEEMSGEELKQELERDVYG